MDTLPNPASDDTTRFEAAPDPDGTLIPIPAEAPQGAPIRDDATITVNPRQQNGYYVTIYNGPPNPPSAVLERIKDLASEAGLDLIEEAILKGAPQVLKFGLGFLGIAASVLTTSPILAERYFRGDMEDGTPVTYVVLTPKEG